MARKPKAIETPGDILPETPTPAKPAGKAKPQPEAANLAATLAGVETTADGLAILERRSGWILTPRGWFKE